MNRKRAPLPNSLKSLRKRLNHRDEHTRNQALTEALALPPEMLLQLMEPEARRARVHGWMQGMVASAGCLWVLTCFVIMIAQFAYHVAFAFWDALLFAAMPCFFVAMQKLETRSRAGSLLSRALLSQNDAQFAAPALLFYCHLDTYASLYDDLRQTLLRLLPQLTPQDVETWTPAHKAALRQQIAWHNLEMLECALQTLASVGNANDIPALRSVATLTPEQIARKIRPYVLDEERAELRRAILADTTPNPKIHGLLDPENEAVMQDKRYQEWCLKRAQDINLLANRSLAALLERTGQQQQATDLLRASAATETDAAQILLRPQVEAEQQTPPEQLLRSTNSNS